MSNTIPGGVGARAALACVAAAIPAADRSAHFALVQRLFHRAVREQLELPNGYAFRFAAETFGEVARFMENERRCCPFLTFTIELAPDGGPLWLRITGPAETRAFVSAELLGRQGEPV